MPDAQMDLYNQEEFEDWPVGPEEDYLAELFTIDTSTAERREANEIVELFLTLGAELQEARGQGCRAVLAASSYSPAREAATAAPCTWPNLRPS